MASPEYEPQQPPQPEVQVRQEQAEIPRDLEQGTGASVVQQTPQPLTDPEDNSQVIAQPVPAPPDPKGPHIDIPTFESEEQIEQYTHGNASDAITWQAVGLIRKIHMAVQKGWAVVFGNNNHNH